MDDAGSVTANEARPAIARLDIMTFQRFNVIMTESMGVAETKQRFAELIDRVHEVKLAFLEEHRAEVPDAGRLRRLAARRRRQELLTYARRCTLPERRFGPTARTLALVGRRAPGLLLDRGAWKLLGGSVIGPGLVERVTGRPDGAGVGGS